MKITSWCKTLKASLVAAGVLLPSVASAINIPLGDPNFENYVVPARGYAYATGSLGTYRPTSPWVDDLDSPDPPPPGPTGGQYTQDDSSSNWLYTAAYAEVTTYSTRPSPRSGNQAMHGLGRYSAQETSAVFEASRTYTFSLWAQNDAVLNEGDGVFLYIFDGTVPFIDTSALKSQLFTSEIPARTGLTGAQSQINWVQLGISYFVAPGAPEIGHPIGVAFFARKDSAVDDAALSSVPEPASAILVGLGGLSLLPTRRKRK